MASPVSQTTRAQRLMRWTMATGCGWMALAGAGVLLDLWPAVAAGGMGCAICSGLLLWQDNLRRRGA